MAVKTQIQKTQRTPEGDRKNLDLAISGINKQFGPGALMRLGETVNARKTSKTVRKRCNKL